jgi:hypothetical protein
MFLQAISAVTAVVAGVRQHLADVAVVAAVADQDGGEEEGGSCDRRQIILTIEFRRFDPDHHSTRIFLLCLHFFLFHFIIKPIQFYKCRWIAFVISKIQLQNDASTLLTSNQEYDNQTVHLSSQKCINHACFNKISQDFFFIKSIGSEISLITIANTTT